MMILRRPDVGVLVVVELVVDSSIEPAPLQWMHRRASVANPNCRENLRVESPRHEPHVLGRIEFGFAMAISKDGGDA